jgi:membrane protein YdbS with pleckstrin-like domain
MSEPTSTAEPSPDDRPHRPADDREEAYFEGSPLLRGELLHVFLFGIIGVLIVAAPFLYQHFAHAWPIWWITLACIVIGIIVLLIPLILIRAIRYRISNYRIDFERGLLSRRIDTLELWHVEDLAFSQSFTDRILGVGNIRIMSHDETTPELNLRGLPNPRPLFESLKQRVIAVKRQRGVIKMDMG